MKKNGYFEEHHENGELKSRGHYQDGLKVGSHERFHENGQLQGKVNFKDGKQDGLAT